ncbi:MAG: hypothetical protein ACYS4W_00810 [Planctomycetota bacterium]|jgi:hypothetical protein
MEATTENGVFFDENVLGRETWRLKQLAKAAQRLIDGSRELCAFIKSGNQKNTRFTISVGSAPDKPLYIYETDVIDEDREPPLRCTFTRG